MNIFGDIIVPKQIGNMNPPRQLRPDLPTAPPHILKADDTSEFTYIIWHIFMCELYLQDVKLDM